MPVSWWAQVIMDGVLDKIQSSGEIVRYEKSSISIFQEFFLVLTKFLVGGLGAGVLI